MLEAIVDKSTYLSSYPFIHMNVKQSKQETTTAPVKWLRVNDAVGYSRLSRATLYNLMDTGQLQSQCVRVKGSLKGMRLISAESIDKLISSSK